MTGSRRLWSMVFFFLVLAVGPFARGSAASRPTVACLKALLGQAGDTPHGEPYRQLALWLDRPEVDGKAIIDYLSRDPKLKARFAADAGVWERYSIREHTLKVYDNFSDQLPYFHMDRIRTPESVNVSRLMKFTIALHDIGKPDAIKAGNKALQHQYTTVILVEKLRQLGFSEAEVNIAKSVVGNDVFGELFKGVISAEQAYVKVNSLAATASLSPREYFRLQSFFYTIDAAAYPILRARIFSNESGRLVPSNPRYRQLEELFN